MAEIKKFKMTENKIEKILTEIGFIKRQDLDEELGYYYEFYQEYPEMHGEKDENRSHLYVSFCLEKKLTVYFNCFNFVNYIKINEIKSEQDFLDQVDCVVLNGKNAFIYSDRCYHALGEAADEQRKRYFKNRMNMKLKPCKEYIDHIKDEGLDHFETILDAKYGDVKIADMSWEQLACTLIEKIKEEKK